MAVMIRAAGRRRNLGMRGMRFHRLLLVAHLKERAESRQTAFIRAVFWCGASRGRGSQDIAAPWMGECADAVVRVDSDRARGADRALRGRGARFAEKGAGRGKEPRLRAGRALAFARALGRYLAGLIDLPKDSLADRPVGVV